jgi:hypothetical protein
MMLFFFNIFLLFFHVYFIFLLKLKQWPKLKGYFPFHHFAVLVKF